MRRMMAAVLIGLGGLACGVVYTRGNPAAGVDEDFASKWGCDLEEVKAQAEGFESGTMP